MNWIIIQESRNSMCAAFYFLVHILIQGNIEISKIFNFEMLAETESFETNYYIN